MAGKPFPLQPTWNTDGDLVGIYVREDWYDPINATITKLTSMSGVAGVGLPLEPLEELRPVVAEVMRDFRNLGVVVTYMIYHVIRMAVQGLITLGKFTYKTVGAGWTNFSESENNFEIEITKIPDPN